LNSFEFTWAWAHLNSLELTWMNLNALKLTSLEIISNQIGYSYPQISACSIHLVRNGSVSKMCRCLNDFGIPVSTNMEGMLIFVWCLLQKLQQHRIQAYPTQEQTYPKTYQHVSKTHCARIQESYLEKSKLIHTWPKWYPNVSKMLDTKRIQNWFVSNIYVSNNKSPKCVCLGPHKGCP